MTNVKQISKYATYEAIALATIIGSCTAHRNDCPPFYINKTGHSGGICAGFYVTTEQDAEFDGLIVSVATRNHGEINGASIKLASRNEGEINGASISLLLNISSNGIINGLEAAIVINVQNNNPNEATRLNGIQIGAYNECKKQNGESQRSFILNPYIHGTKSKTNSVIKTQ
jgi:hypothetical protein